MGDSSFDRVDVGAKYFDGIIGAAESQSSPRRGSDPETEKPSAKPQVSGEAKG